MVLKKYIYRRSVISISLILTGIIVCFLFINRNASALTVNDGCKKVEIIFARGSGAALDNRESDQFEREISKRLSGALAPHYYELGTESYGFHKYKAITVDPKQWEGLGNASGAFVSAGMYHDYGASVRSGVGELRAYLKQRYEKCKSSGTYYILAGHSQGAQVIGQSMNDNDMPKKIRDRIVFVGLFGDPKLYLKEGEGPFWDTPACKGKNFSQYRRVIGDCYVNQGRLGARKEYLPDDMKTKTGLWCYKADFVCGTSHFFWDNKGHESYANKGMAVDSAAAEAATRLKEAIKHEPKAPSTPNTPPQDVEKDIDTQPSKGMGTTGQDVVFMLDTSSVMTSQLQALKQFIKTKGAQIKANGGNFTIASYCSERSGINSWMPSMKPLTFKLMNDNIAHSDLVIDYLAAPCAETYPNDLTYIHYVVLSLTDWHPGATKSVVLLGSNAPVQSPSPMGVTSAMLAKLSLSIDPVNIYPVVPTGSDVYYQHLADSTSGQVTTYTDDIVGAAESAYNKIDNRPVALLKNSEYSADVGQEVTYDASDSYVIGSEIVKYEWDFDGDNTFEMTTSKPVASHTYDQMFDDMMQVKVTAANGLVANHSVPVKIGTAAPQALPDAPTSMTAKVLSTENDKSTVRLNWTLPDNLPANWVLTVNGAPLGRMDSTRTTIDVTDVDMSFDNDFGVAGMTADNMVGEGAFATLYGPELEPIVLEDEDDGQVVVPGGGTGNHSKTDTAKVSTAVKSEENDDSIVLGVQDVIVNGHIDKFSDFGKGETHKYTSSGNNQSGIANIFADWYAFAIGIVTVGVGWLLFSYLRKPS